MQMQNASVVTIVPAVTDASFCPSRSRARIRPGKKPHGDNRVVPHAKHYGR